MTSRREAILPTAGLTSTAQSATIPLAAVLAIVLATDGALAADCGSAAACQIQQQEMLLAPFNSLGATPEGRRGLGPNLQTINAIYLNPTQAQKTASGTVRIQQDIPANLLLRA